ncbi:trafficking protein particle complex 1 [Plasmopara halstedii]|uniref:Trafficking protein particle complex subunit n=1 Tax=Plasmopara halstedii TaxID=4781 RepID=A0A0P1ASX4_PLAHL|nr:trafficking protein particle complex 1 [Plasmopara halstedii]CEG44076.1 trafficking protein particle complex 1 [Plasmopara halstedii]|eukprot:XP_024580445.1 trafficking protein particle complex 1 [Plasmopara halstedii]
MIYSFYIYTRNGSCLYQEKWNVTGGKSVTYSDPEEERRLLFGLLFSLKEFVCKIAPSTITQTSSDPIGSNEPIAAAPEGLQRFQTNAYTCHQYESPSGLRFVMMTDNQAGDLTPTLKYIYAQIYVETVVGNPLCDTKSGKPITSHLFRTQLTQYLENQPCFK